MQDVGNYVLHIITAAIISALATRFLGDSGVFGSAIKLLSGMFMILAVVAPWTDLRLDILSQMAGDIDLEAAYVTAEGENSAQEAMSQIISTRTQAYILDKANELGAELTVAVFLTDEAPPVPFGVQLTGKISPYNKTILSNWLDKNLGITPEEQIWID